MSIRSGETISVRGLRPHTNEIQAIPRYHSRGQLYLVTDASAGRILPWAHRCREDEKLVEAHLASAKADVWGVSWPAIWAMYGLYGCAHMRNIESLPLNHCSNASGVFLDAELVEAAGRRT